MRGKKGLERSDAFRVELGEVVVEEPPLLGQTERGGSVAGICLESGKSGTPRGLESDSIANNQHCRLLSMVESQKQMQQALPHDP